MKEYRIRYTPEAMRDMDAVWDEVYEASGSLDVAKRYIDDFMDAIERKKNFPLTGIPLSYRGLFTGFYSVNFKAYKAFYRIRDDYMEVTRIIMQRKDFMKILFGEKEN